MRFDSAISTAPTTDHALDEVLADLSQQLPHDGDVAFVFASMDHAGGFPTIHARLSEALGLRTTLGCTCGGVIGVQRELEGGAGLSVLVGELPGAVLEPFSYEQIDWPAVVDDPAGLRESITSKPDVRVLLLLADPFSAPMIRLLPALGEALPGVPVIGGMASAAREAGKNRLMLDGRVLTDGAVGVAISGALRVQTTVSQGCRPIGSPFVITKAKRHVVQELGGVNALQALRQMASELDSEDQKLIQTNGLFVGRVLNEYKSRFGPGDFLVRGLIGVDNDNGYIAIGDPQVRVGQTIQFQVRDQTSAADDFNMLLQAQRIHGEASGALLFTCNGRGTNLFDRVSADAEMIHDALGDVPLAGFFAAGEIGPVGDASFLHGHTASLVVFREPD